MRPAVLTIALVLGCSRRAEPAITAEPAASKVVTPETETKKRGVPDWSCASSADCTISCAWGAVNKRWLAEKKPRDCKDGCQELARAVCDQGTCVAVGDGDSGTIKTCTHIECPPHFDELDHCAQEFP